MKDRTKPLRLAARLLQLRRLPVARPRFQFLLLAVAIAAIPGVATWAQNTSDAPAPRTDSPGPGRESLPLSPLIVGVLYTRGGVDVDWNGKKIPVESGSYPYLGSEIVETDETALGVLRLGAAGTIYICPRSRVRVALRDGRYQLDVLDGSSRFVFDHSTDFVIQANETSVAPDELRADDDPAEREREFIGEIVAKEERGCAICEYQRRVRLTARPADATADEDLGVAEPGEVTDVYGDGDLLVPGRSDEAAEAQEPVQEAAASDERESVTRRPMARDLLENIERNVDDTQLSQLAYFCQCGQLRDDTERAAREAESDRAAEEAGRATRGQGEQTPGDESPGEDSPDTQTESPPPDSVTDPTPGPDTPPPVRDAVTEPTTPSEPGPAPDEPPPQVVVVTPPPVQPPAGPPLAPPPVAPPGPPELQPPGPTPRPTAPPVPPPSFEPPVILDPGTPVLPPIAPVPDIVTGPGDPADPGPVSPN